MNNKHDQVPLTNLFPLVSYEENRTPDCGVEIDHLCEEIHKACKGWGTDEKRLINAIGNTTGEERLKIAIRYKDIYGKDLKSMLKSEAGGDFGLSLQCCAFDPISAECFMIHAACKGLGSHKDALSSILCGRSNRDMDLLKKTFYRMYTKDLIEFVGSETGGDLKKLLISCMQAVEEDFDVNYHTEEKAIEDAKTIYKAGQARWGTNEEKMFKVIVLSPPQYLMMVNEKYAKNYGFSLKKAMDSELSGHSKTGAMHTVGMKLYPFEAIADLIKHACAGLGTDEMLLTYCIIRYQHVMGHVNLMHTKLFGKSVQDRVRSEVSGDYKKLLLALINKVSPEE